jgi:hypothetical protein
MVARVGNVDGRSVGSHRHIRRPRKQPWLVSRGSGRKD